MNGKTYKVTEIDTNACKQLAKLTQVTIGKNVSRIGKNAFYLCKKLDKIIIKTTKLTAKSVGTNAFKTENTKKTVVTCPKANVEEYQTILTKKGLDKKTSKFTK